MYVRSLGYLRWRSPEPDAWHQFATGILGMMEGQSTVESDTRLYRMDDEPYRLAVVSGDEPGIDGLGFRVDNSVALDELTVRLDQHQVTWTAGNVNECADRRVGEFVRCEDPAGVTVEFYSSPVSDHTRVDTPFVDGFVAGDLGIGHVVTTTPDMEASARFYRDVLGFQLRNTMYSTPSADGSTLGSVHFYGCNPRHHTVALLEHPVPGILRHFMIEMSSLDDVGAAMDRCLDSGVTLHSMLGRHTNDLMASFYASAPDGTSVEIGFDGLQVNTATWATHEITARSFWGHRPVPAAVRDLNGSHATPVQADATR